MTLAVHRLHSVATRCLCRNGLANGPLSVQITTIKNIQSLIFHHEYRRGGNALARSGQLDRTLQVGGSWSACQRHIDAVKGHPLLRGHDIDFKLTLSPGPANQDCQTESAFDTLLLRQVDELVTLGPRARGQAHLRNGGQHVTPEVFHNCLQQHQAGNADVVLLDARNIYESRIGYFQAVRGTVTVYIQFSTSAAQPPLQAYSWKHV